MKNNYYKYDVKIKNNLAFSPHCVLFFTCYCTVKWSLLECETRHPCELPLFRFETPENGLSDNVAFGNADWVTTFPHQRTDIKVGTFHPRTCCNTSNYTY